MFGAPERDQSTHIFGIMDNNLKYSAVVLLDNEYLVKLANELDDDLIIFPSSIHEIVAIPAGETTLTTDELDGMVAQINATEVDSEDRLVDHTYYFDRNKGELFIAKEVRP